MAHARHPHDKLIRAWLDGERIQYLAEPGVWADLESAGSVTKLPHFYTDREYRVTPIEVRYRLCWMRDDTPRLAIACSLQQAAVLARDPKFGGWHGDWTVAVLA